MMDPIKRYHFSIGGGGLTSGGLGLCGVIESRSDDIALAGLQRILDRIEGHTAYMFEWWETDSGWLDHARSDYIAIYTNAMVATMEMFDSITVDELGERKILKAPIE
jgi:hypothetical protein